MIDKAEQERKNTEKAGVVSDVHGDVQGGLIDAHTKRAGSRQGAFTQAKQPRAARRLCARATAWATGPPRQQQLPAASPLRQQPAARHALWLLAAA